MLGGISGTLTYLFFEPKYEASSWLQIEATAPYLAYPTQDDSRRFIETQRQLICSPLVLGPVISQPEIARLRDIEEQDDPITWLREELEVKSVGQSELFTVSFRSPEPANAARIVNAVTDAFFKLRGQQDAQRVQQVIELLKQERERRASELGRLRENVRELTKQATGRDPFAAAPPVEGDPLQSHPLAELHSRLITAEVEQEILKAQIKAFEELVSQREVEVPEGLVQTRVEQSEEIQTRNALLLEKRAKLAEIKEKSAKGEEDPSYKRLKTEIDQDEGTLEQVRKDMATQIKVEVETDLANRRKAGLEQMQSELENYSFMQKALQERYDSQLAELKQYSGETLELEFKRAELARAEEVHNLITARAVQLRTEQRAPVRIRSQREGAKTPQKNATFSQSAAQGAALGGENAAPDPQLAGVIQAWPSLPPAVRAGILAMVKATGGSDA